MKKIRLKLMSLDLPLLEKAVKSIVQSAQVTGALIGGPLPLPTKRKIFTVLRSPHVDKNSMEQYKLEWHKRLVDVFLPLVQSRTIDALMNLELPVGVEVVVKT